MEPRQVYLDSELQVETKSNSKAFELTGLDIQVSSVPPKHGRIRQLESCDPSIQFEVRRECPRSAKQFYPLSPKAHDITLTSRS